MECSGNELYFDFGVKSPMCPSMKVSNQRIHSPEGRATLVCEWLRLLADRDVDPNQPEKVLPEQGVSLHSLVARARNSWYVCKGGYDFSHKVKEAISGCLTCKVCSTQRPIKVDVSEFCSCLL